MQEDELTDLPALEAGFLRCFGDLESPRAPASLVAAPMMIDDDDVLYSGLRLWRVGARRWKAKQ